ncbi:MAG: diguanylate cyclase [Arenimonas sp.]
MSADALPPVCAECEHARELVTELQTRLDGEAEGQRLAGAELVRSRDALQAFMDAITESALLLDADGTIRAVNRTVCQRLGHSPAELIGQSAYDSLAPDVAAERRAHVMQVIDSGLPAHFIDQRLGRQIENAVYPVFGTDGAVRQLAIIGIDVTERLSLQQAVEAARRRLQTLIGNLPGMAYRCRNDRDWTLEFISDGCEELTGYSAPALVDNRLRSYADLIHPEDRERVWQTVQAGVDGRRRFVIDYRIRTAGGAERWVHESGLPLFDAEGNLEALEGFISDITEQRMAEQRLQDSLQAQERLNRALEDSHRELAELAIRDPLTRLYNRRFMEEALARELVRAEREVDSLAVAMLDLDHFKAYNDDYGHAAGDAMLRAFAQAMHGFRQGSDVACRFGGEEFVLILPGLDRHGAFARLDAFRRAVSVMTVQHEGRELPRLRVSIGVSFYPAHGRRVDDLLKQADQAMYRAKQTGRDRVVLAE